MEPKLIKPNFKKIKERSKMIDIFCDSFYMLKVKYECRVDPRFIGKTWGELKKEIENQEFCERYEETMKTFNRFSIKDNTPLVKCELRIEEIKNVHKMNIDDIDKAFRTGAKCRFNIDIGISTPYFITRSYCPAYKYIPAEILLDIASNAPYLHGYYTFPVFYMTEHFVLSLLVQADIEMISCNNEYTWRGGVIAEIDKVISQLS